MAKWPVSVIRTGVGSAINLCAPINVIGAKANILSRLIGTLGYGFVTL